MWVNNVSCRGPPIPMAAVVVVGCEKGCGFSGAFGMLGRGGGMTGRMILKGKTVTDSWK